MAPAPFLRPVRGQALLALLVLAATLFGVGEASPVTLGRPFVGGLPPLKRSTSADPSCPSGYMCEQTACGGGIFCGVDEQCIDFEGTVACAPTDMGWCALNPSTFEAVGCAQGNICCHGNCYTSDAVCCDNPGVTCTVGTLCNACEPGQTCQTGATSTCLGTGTGGGGGGGGGGTQSSTTMPNNAPTSVSSSMGTNPTATVVPNVDTYNSIGCYSDQDNARTLVNGTETSGSMTVEMCVNLAMQGGWQYAGVEYGDECYVGNAIMNGAYQQGGCTMACAGASGEICGGGNAINIYQDTTWTAPTVPDLQAAFNTYQSDIDNFQQAISSWYNYLMQGMSGSGSISAAQAAAYLSSAIDTGSGLPESGSILLRRVNGAVSSGLQPSSLATDTESTLTSINSIASSLSQVSDPTDLDIAAGFITSIGAPAAVAAASTLAATAAYWEISVLYCAFSGCNAGTPAPPPTTNTTGTPDDYVILFVDEMTQKTFDVLTSQIIQSGGQILDTVMYESVNWFHMYATLYPAQVTTMIAYPLLSSICLDAPIIIDDPTAIDLPSGVAARNDGDGYVVNLNSSFAKAEAEASLVPRVTVANALIQVPSADNTVPSWMLEAWLFTMPFHLLYLSMLWAKTALSGAYADVWYYVWDGSVSAVDVYVVDSGLDTAHQEFSRVTEGYDYSSGGTNGAVGTMSPTMADTMGHGTRVATFVGGRVMGVNTNANIIPVKIGTTDMSTSGAAKAFGELCNIQNIKGNKTAVLNMSWGIKISDMTNNQLLQNLPPGITDPFQRFLDKLFFFGMIVMASAGNQGEAEATQAQLPLYSPTSFGGTTSHLIVIGSTSFDSSRSSTSSARDDNGVGYVTAYMMGNGIWGAMPGTGTAYGYIGGTSFAAPAAAGVMSLIVGGDATTTPTNAKGRLLALATSRKGTNWPNDPYSPLAGAPRLATNSEISCQPVTPGTPFLPTYVYYGGNPQVNLDIPTSYSASAFIATPGLQNPPVSCISLTGSTTTAPVPSFTIANPSVNPTAVQSPVPSNPV